MTDDEYSIVASLTRLRIASDAVRDSIQPMEDDGTRQEIQRALSRMIAKLERAVDKAVGG